MDEGTFDFWCSGRLLQIELAQWSRLTTLWSSTKETLRATMITMDDGLKGKRPSLGSLRRGKRPDMAADKGKGEPTEVRTS